MKRLERYNLIDTISRHLQQGMTTTGINVYLGGFRIEYDAVDIVDSKRFFGCYSLLLPNAQENRFLADSF